MTIDAGHWAIIVSRVSDHARKLFPNDEKKRRRLTNELLGITTEEDLREDMEELRSRGESWYKQFLPSKRI